MAFETTLVTGSTKVWMIRVEYVDHKVRIENNTNLSDFLKTESAGSLTLAKRLKEMYKTRTGKTLNINTNSLAIEILAHVYPDKVGKAINGVSGVPQAIKNLINKYILQRTDIIDCGEEGYDDNRGYWDILAGLGLVIV